MADTTCSITTQCRSVNTTQLGSDMQGATCCSQYQVSYNLALADVNPDVGIFSFGILPAGVSFVLTILLQTTSLLTSCCCAIKPGGVKIVWTNNALRIVPCRKAKVSKDRVTLERKQYGVILFFTCVAFGLFHHFLRSDLHAGDDSIHQLAVNDLFCGIAVIISIIGFLPSCWSYIEGRENQDGSLGHTKTGNKVLIAVATILIAVEFHVIRLAIRYLNGPVLYSLVFFAVFIPAVSGGLFLFVYFDQTTRGKVFLSRTHSLVELQDRKLQHVLNPLKQSQFNIDSQDLHLMERIGAGGCGWIYQATLGENTIVAAKEIISSVIDSDFVEFEHEARMLTQLNHPHVLRVFGFCTKPAEENVDNQEHKYIVTEFAPGGSLENAIEGAIKIQDIVRETKSGAIQMPFSKIQCLEWALQIASGMTFLHGRGFVHRDMKTHNVLLNKSNDCLVADLGTVRRPEMNEAETKMETGTDQTLTDFCQQIGENGNSAMQSMPNNNEMTKSMGTPMFMAPEQYSVEYSYPVDVWAYGLTLIRLFTLKWPYAEENVMRLVVGIARGELRPIEVALSDVPDSDVLAVINDCLMHDPSVRPSFKGIEKRLSEALKRCRK